MSARWWTQLVLGICLGSNDSIEILPDPLFKIGEPPIQKPNSFYEVPPRQNKFFGWGVV